MTTQKTFGIFGIAIIFLLSVISFTSAASVTISLFYDSTDFSILQINDGESATFSVNANSVAEESMTIVVDLMGPEGNKNILDVFTQADSYNSGDLVIEKDFYSKPGSYTIMAVVKGASGQETSDFLILHVLPLSEDNNLPVITSKPVTSINENTFYSYDVDATDLDKDVLTYTLTQKPEWLSIDSQTGVVSGTSPPVDETYQFIATVQVSDGKGFDSQTFTIDVKNVVVDSENNVPVIVSSPDTQVDEGQSYFYDVEATDADGDVLVYSMLGPDWLSINSQTGLISGTAPQVNENTVFQINILVEDGRTGVAVQTYTITVIDKTIIPMNTAPVANNQDVVTNINTEVTISLSATDSEGDSLTYSVVSGTSNGVLSAVNPSTGVLIYTPGNGFTGSDSFTFRVNDGTENSNVATVSITVNQITLGNNAPVIVSSPVTSVNENSNYAYDVNATDADGDTLTYILSSAPSWLTINTNTGLISGTAPQVSSNTQFSIVVQVSDGNGGITAQSYTLTVVNTSGNGGGSGGKKGGGLGVETLPTDEFYTEKYFNQFNPIVLGEDTQPASPMESPLKPLAKVLLWLFVLIVLLVILIILFWLRRV